MNTKLLTIVRNKFLFLHLVGLFLTFGLNHACLAAEEVKSLLKIDSVDEFTNSNPLDVSLSKFNFVNNPLEFNAGDFSNVSVLFNNADLPTVRNHDIIQELVFPESGIFRDINFIPEFVEQNLKKLSDNEHVSLASALWLFGTALVGFASFVNRKKI